MVFQLRYIELENFKSYKGFRKLGPLPSFLAVIGPNGSGKSNFMDAISFVMGEKTQSLRVKRLSDLIHGASINRPVANRASVSAVFVNDADGQEMTFTRSIIGSSSDHKINNENVSSQEYLQKLEQLGINVNAKNFLVFQGAVESIAMKNPKERTTLFEEISGSGAKKKEYDRLKDEMMAAEENTQYTYQKKKTLGLERKEAKMEKEEAEKYKKLQDSLADRQVELQLFKLYHNERKIGEYDDEAQAKRKEVDKIEKKKEKLEDKLKDVKKEQAKAQREFTKVDSDIREKENSIQKKRPAFIKAKEKSAHLQKKQDNARKSLKQAEKAHKAHHGEVQELESELRNAERKMGEYEDMVSEESQSQGKNLQLAGSQVKEYLKLKEKAGKESARYMSQLDSITREQKSDQDKLDTENRKKYEMESKLKNKGHELEESEKRLDKLSEHIRQSETQLEEQQKIYNDMQGDVGCSKDRITQLQRDLEQCQYELGDARVDKHEDNRRKKKQEIVENFKRLYPGVFDRLINMSQPIHKKYNVAITKQLGRYMEAIVVDCEATARQCIQYLKDQMLEPETFLPLDYIKTTPLKERLRNIKNPNGVKLLYDVLRYEPSDIKQAVLFVTNNALVCETPDDAMKVAYELEPGQRYDAIALDGTSYQKSGIISGGSVDLARKAKRWDDKQVSTLKSRKEKLTEELRQAMKNSRKESEIQTIQSQISGLKTRLKYSTTDRDNTKKKIVQLKKTMEKMEEDLEGFAPKIAEYQLDRPPYSQPRQSHSSPTPATSQSRPTIRDFRPPKQHHDFERPRALATSASNTHQPTGERSTAPMACIETQKIMTSRRRQEARREQQEARRERKDREDLGSWDELNNSETSRDGSREAGWSLPRRSQARNWGDLGNDPKEVGPEGDQDSQRNTHQGQRQIIHRPKKSDRRGLDLDVGDHDITIPRKPEDQEPRPLPLMEIKINPNSLITRRPDVNRKRSIPTLMSTKVAKKKKN